MSAPEIHPTAIVSPHANLADGVRIGPYAIIEDNVEMGEGCVVGPHVIIHAYVRMGAGNKIHGHAVIGDLPQDLGFDQASETWVEIKNNNVIREHATIHRATIAGVTRIGSDCYIMTNVHIGHDCQLGSGIIMASNTGLGGHTHVGDKVVFGAAVGVHQFTRIGCYVMCAGMMTVRKDVMPYTMVAGEPAKHYRLNTIGLRRSGVKAADYKALEKAFREVRRGNKTLEGVEQTSQVKHLGQWLAADSKRGLTGFLK